MKASDYIAAFLAANGVTAVYEMTGGMITHLLDSIGAREDISVVSVHHEQAAAFAAEAGARMTGVPGVALATSGPGATNLITGIGSCFFDSVPAVFITGQVNTHELAGDSGVRQAGFQETDIVAIVEPITKAAWRVARAEDLPGVLAQAFSLASSGRPGPVLIDIPMNVQREQVDVEARRVTVAEGTEPLDVTAVIAAIAEAKRPLILVGGGVRAAGACAALTRFARLTRTPVATTLMGLDVVPYDDELRVGMIGTYGNRWANLALGDADLVLVLGARLDVRQTGADVAGFVRGKTIVQVDVDAAQLGWRVSPDQAVEADVAAFLAAALDAGEQREWDDRAEWFAAVRAHAARWPDAAELADIAGINPAEVVARLSAHATPAVAYVADVGQNQMWAAQSLRLAPGQRFLTSGGMGAMGFALPAAMGAAVAVPGHPVVAIAGDGGMQVNIQELETVARLDLPIKMLVFNNGCLGMVRQFQDENFESRYHSTVWGYGAPDFVKVGTAYGIAARRVEAPDEVEDALEWFMSDPASPALLEVKLSSGTCVRPKVAFGNPVHVMEPPPLA